MSTFEPHLRFEIYPETYIPVGDDGAEYFLREFVHAAGRSLLMATYSPAIGSSEPVTGILYEIPDVDMDAMKAARLQSERMKLLAPAIAALESKGFNNARVTPVVLDHRDAFDRAAAALTRTEPAAPSQPVQPARGIDTSFRPL